MVYGLTSNEEKLEELEKRLEKWYENKMEVQ
jgi:hypothetical protein